MVLEMPMKDRMNSSSAMIRVLMVSPAAAAR